MPVEIATPKTIAPDMLVRVTCRWCCKVVIELPVETPYRLIHCKVLQTGIANASNRVD